MKHNIIISGMAVYHPKTAVQNEFYVEHFRKQGKDVKKLFGEVFGRNTRFEIHNEGKPKKEHENSLTMEIAASKKVLELCKLEGTEIDAIILTGQVMEYTLPCSATYIYHAIGGKRDCFCYDLNANCEGMVMAYQQVAQYMAFNPRLQNVLVVGGDYMTFGLDKNEETLYGVFGDSALAMVLSRTEGDSGLVDFDYFMHDMLPFTPKIPNCGYSNIHSATPYELKTREFEKPECDLDIVASKIQSLLQKHHLKVEDITAFCLSQYVKKNIEYVRDALNIPQEKCPYVGDKYGYTGSNSPFLALCSYIKENEVKHGDYLFFWTIGIGMQHIFLLIKY